MSDIMHYDEAMDLIRRKAYLEALITEREGMLALNRERLSHGHTEAYGEDAFINLANSMREIAALGWTP